MKTIWHTLIVKSIPDNWNKERYWIKNNTVREVPNYEQEIFDKFLEKYNSWNPVYIEIVNTEELTRFDREVTDITKFKDNIYIISFKSR